MTLRQLFEKLKLDRGGDAYDFLFYVRFLEEISTFENYNANDSYYNRLIGFILGFKLLGYITDSDCENILEEAKNLFLFNRNDK